MNTLKNLWNNFKTQPDIWFFYGFLLTFTLSIRKVIKFYPIAGQFNEYSGIYLYLSDIFLILTLISWGIFILRNKSEYLSSIKRYFALNSPPHQNSYFANYFPFYKILFRFFGFFKAIILWCGGKPLYTFLLIFNLWVFASIFWSNNQAVALFRAIKILEFSLLLLYISYKVFHPSRNENVPRPSADEAGGTISSYGAGACPPQNCSTWNNSGRVEQSLGYVFQIIIFLGLFQAIIGIWQIIIQKSVGLFWLKESLISPDLPGVAKIVLNGEKFIRAYGLFPHPNILGGFLLVSIIMTFYFLKFCHSERDETRSRNLLIRSLGMLRMTILIIQLIALFLTFSKSDIIGFFIAILYISWKIYNLQNVPHGTIRWKKMFHPRRNVPPQKECSTPEGMFHVEHPTGQAWNILRGRRGTSYGAGVEHLWKKTAIFILLLIIISNWLNFNWYTFLAKSWSERETYLNVSRGTIISNPIFGTGIGQFVLNMQKYTGSTLESWQFQPVHNVFLLIWSELGLVGLTIFLLFLYYLLRLTVKAIQSFTNRKDEESRQYSVLYTLYKGLLFSFLFIALFDHYLWDIQSGQAIFWLTIGLFSRVEFHLLSRRDTI